MMKNDGAQTIRFGLILLPITIWHAGDSSIFGKTVYKMRENEDGHENVRTTHSCSYEKLIGACFYSFFVTDWQRRKPLARHLPLAHQATERRFSLYQEDNLWIF